MYFRRIGTIFVKLYFFSKFLVTFCKPLKIVCLFRFFYLKIYLLILSIYNTIKISHCGDLTANVSEDGKSSECNRFFVTYIAISVSIFQQKNNQTMIIWLTSIVWFLF